MPTAQPGVLLPPPVIARYLSFDLLPEADPDTVREVLSDLVPQPDLLVGLGAPLVALLGLDVPALRPFPALSGPGTSAPSTQTTLWLRVSASDRGLALQAGRQLELHLGDCFALVDVVDGFVHAGGRDLSGYVDGTENPTGDAAATAALAADGSSFVAVQQWVHDLDALDTYPEHEADRLIGRTREGDVELEDAPASAHVKRTAQESYTPAAFVVRRSVPWTDGEAAGLLFIAFGRNLDAYEAQLRRMMGLDDGITDALFRFSKPLSGGYYWVAPVDEDGALAL